MSQEEMFEMLEQFARQATEHFEAIQILATYTEDGVSHSVKVGAGNWYARVGMVTEFLNTDQAQVQANELRDVLPPNDEYE